MAIGRRGWRRGRVLFAAIAFAALAATPALAVDWTSVPAREVVLFYPGQASWEWVLTPSDHSGAKKFRGGKNCGDCHRGEEADIGAKIVSGKKLEPNPIPGRRGSIKLEVKMAVAGDRLHVQLQWPAGTSSGGPKMEPDFAEKVTVMLDDGSLVEATRAGCWGSCHDDAIGMASADPNVKLTKYLVESRTKVTRQGGDESYKSASGLDALIKAGKFLEYWQARLNPGAPAKAVDGYILDKRHENATPAISATAEMRDGNWVVELSRKLVLGDPLHKDLVEGKTYTLGFAVHDDYAAHRYHDISFENTLVLGSGKADFVAAKQ